MANILKVRSHIKDFLEKMKAMDEAIPEELAEDALEMVEEVNDALCEETEDENPDVLEITRDEDPDEKDIDKKVEDAVNRALRNAGLIKDKAMSSLDEVEEELKIKDKCAEDEDENSDNVLDADGEEKVTVDPEKIGDSASMLKFVREVKPMIAGIKDARIRRKLSDSVAKFAKMNMGGNDQYSKVLETTRRNATDSFTQKQVDNAYEDGMKWANKFNPHYKKEDK